MLQPRSLSLLSRFFLIFALFWTPFVKAQVGSTSTDSLAVIQETIGVFDAAIAKDPENYLNYFKRAAAYLQFGRTQQALQDFTKVLNIKPDFEQARLQRGKIYAKEGMIDEALDDFDNIFTKDSSVAELVEQIRLAKKNIQKATTAQNQKQWDVVIELLSDVFNVVPQNARLRLQRAEAYERKGDLEMAIADLSRAIKLNPSALDPYSQIARLYITLGEPENALTQIRECLRVDPENKKCKSQFRELKKLDKKLKSLDTLEQAKNYQKLAESLVDDVIPDVEKKKCGDKLKKRLFDMACSSFAALKKWEDVGTYCTKTLAIDGNNVEALLNRAEAHIQAEEYDAALNDYKRAHELDSRNQRIIEGYQRAQRLQRQAGRKDYYKILGVKRDATDKEIKRAYNNLARQWHPDKYRGELPKDKVEAKMSDINKAYEILKDPELRARFDNGEDPNDPTGGYGGGGNPMHEFFQQGGFPFGGFGGFGGQGGGGYTFKMRYG